MATPNNAGFREQCSRLQVTLGQLQDVLKQLSEINSNHLVKYTDAINNPPWVGVDADGNIGGFNFNTNDYTLALIMLEALEDFYGNKPVAQSDYATSLNTITGPTGRSTTE